MDSKIGAKLQKFDCERKCLMVAVLLGFLVSYHLQVLGVQSDVLFPVTQQRELEALLKKARKCC